MSLTQEVHTILADADDAYKDGLEQANPVPDPGTYTLLLRGIKVAKRKTKEKGDIPVITLALEVVSHPEYPDYRFALDFWASNSRGMGELSTFSTVANGKPLPDLPSAYNVLSQCVDRAMFDVEVTKDSYEGKEYPHLRALRATPIEALSEEAEQAPS